MKSNVLKVIEESLNRSKKLSLDLLGKTNIAEQKGDRDYALEADIIIQREIAKILRRELDVPLLGDEGINNFEFKDCKLFWVIDPIDGTINYSRGIPEYGISIALIENGLAVLGGIVFPLLNESYIAIKGGGAFRNGERIFVSKVSEELINTVVGFGDFSVKGNKAKKNDEKIRLLNLLSINVLRVRMPGSAALQLAWLSSGKIDISITLSNLPWDVQAGVLLVREAGGLVYDIQGCQNSLKSKETIASNEKLKNIILSLLWTIKNKN